MDEEPEDTGAAAGIIEPPVAGMLDPLKAGFLDPLVAGMLDPLKAGFLDPLKAGFLDPLAAGMLDPLKAGFLDPLVAGIIELVCAEAYARVERMKALKIIVVVGCGNVSMKNAYSFARLREPVPPEKKQWSETIHGRFGYMFDPPKRYYAVL